VSALRRGSLSVVPRAVQEGRRALQREEGRGRGPPVSSCACRARAEYEATGSQRIMFRRGIAELQHLVSGALADGPAGAGGGADEADDEVGPGPRVQRVD